MLLFHKIVYFIKYIYIIYVKNIVQHFILKETRITIKGYQTWQKIYLFPVQDVSLSNSLKYVWDVGVQGWAYTRREYNCLEFYFSITIVFFFVFVFFLRWWFGSNRLSAALPVSFIVFFQKGGITYISTQNFHCYQIIGRQSLDLCQKKNYSLLVKWFLNKILV